MIVNYIIEKQSKGEICHTTFEIEELRQNYSFNEKNNKKYCEALVFFKSSDNKDFIQTFTLIKENVDYISFEEIYSQWCIHCQKLIENGIVNWGTIDSD